MDLDNLTNKIEDKIFVLLHLAEDQLKLCNYVYAETLLTQARDLLPQTNDLVLKLFHNDVSVRLCITQSKYEEAYSWASDSLSMAKDPLPLSRISFLVAQCLFPLKGRDDEVINHCNNAIMYSDTFDDQDAFQTEPMRLKARVAYENGDDDQAFKYINECIQYSEIANMPIEKAVALSIRARIFERQGKLNLALDDLYLAEQYVKDGHDYNHFCSIAIQRLGLMFQMGLDDEAKKAIMAISNDFVRK